MANLEDVVQKVVIIGAGEAGGQFIELGRHGADAFKEIGEGVDFATGKLAGFGGGVLGAVTAVAGLVAGIAAFGLKAAEMGHHLEVMGNVVGTNAGGFKALEAAWGSAGGRAEDFDRILSRMSGRLAITMQQVEKNAREAPVHEEAAAERIVAAKLHIEEAQNKAATSSQEWANKLRNDAITVQEAWVKLEFAAQDAASKMQNSMLSAAGAALGVEAAEQRLQELRAKTGGGTAPTQQQKDSLAIRQAEQAVEQARQRQIDAETARAKAAQTTPLDTQKAGLGVDQALLKQTQDLSASFIAPAKEANELAKAFTQLKEASNSLIDAERRNVENVIRAMEQHDQKFLIEAGPQMVRQAVIAQAMQRPDFSADRAPIQILEQIHEDLVKGMLPTSGALAASLGQQLFGGRGGEGVQALQRFKEAPFDRDQLEAAIKKGEIDKQFLEASEQGTQTIKLKNQAENAAAEAMVRFGNAIQPVPDLLEKFGDALKKVAPISAAATGKASGGHIQGPGTGTSDTAGLFALSHGEYVVRAAAVSKYGLGVMEAINNMALGGFALGGYAGGFGVRRMAEGGPVRGGGSSLTLVLDGRRFEGLHAPDGVASQLKSYAISRQDAQTGPKPSWYK